ncbi:Dabb family protein [Amycolatopsis magusensis]|uniref:Dabb family protein n=1 Tax=Amycolatopsis magusensis TaxID=882444 RepID=UPI003C300B4F
MEPSERHCHIVVPTVSQVLVGRGGLNHYRGLALAVAELMPATVHQNWFDLPDRTEWNVRRAPVRTWRPLGRLVPALEAGVTGDDLIIKYAGAAGVQSDIELDTALLRLREATGCTLIYADPDAPHRLPLLNRDVARPWSAFDEIWCFQGGERAVAEYERLAGPGTVVRQAPFGVSALPAVHQPPGPLDHASWLRRDHDLLVTVGAASAREDRLAALLAEFAATTGKIRICALGDIAPDRSAAWREAGAVLEVRPSCDPHDLLPAYRQSRFTLNLLREECREYPDVPPCRLFEAAAMGSIPITDGFSGLVQYFGENDPLLHLRGGAPPIGEFASTREQAPREARSCAERIATEAKSRLQELLRHARRRSRPCGPGPSEAARPKATLAVTAALKNGTDRRLRANGVEAAVVYVDTADRGAASLVRWVPGRDVALPDDSAWPWLPRAAFHRTDHPGVPMSALVHVVLLRFRPASTGDQRSAFLRGLEELLRATPTASDFVFGLDTSVIADGDHYDFALCVRFPDLAAYEAYEASSAHARFVDRCASALVVGRATTQFWWTEANSSTAVPAGKP